MSLIQSNTQFMLENIKNSFQDRKRLWIIGAIVIVLIIAVVVVFFSTRPKSKSVASTPINLTWWQTGDIKAADYDQVIANFRKIPGNASISIDIQDKSLDDQYYYKLLTDYARDIAPDIFTIRNDDLPAYKEYLSPIDVINGKSLVDYQQNFVNLAVKDTMDKDKVFGVTSYVDNLELFYNKKLLDQNAVTRPPSSWNELTRQIPLITKKALDGNSFLTSTIALGTGGRTPQGEPNIENHSDIIPLLIFQNGGTVYDTQNKIVTLDKQNNSNQKSSATTSFSDDSNKSDAYKALRFYLDFADNTTQNYTWNRDSAKSIQTFTQGNLAYVIQYKSFANTIKKLNNRLNFDVTSIPQLNDSDPATFGRFYMSVLNRKLSTGTDANAKARYQKAQEFMQYLTTHEAQQSMTDKTGLPSSNRSVNSKQQDGDQTTRIFAKGAIYAQNYYKPDVAQTEKVWSNLFERVQYRNETLDQSLNEATNDYQRLVELGPRTRR